MISDLESLVKERASWRASGKKVVLTNGCFDLLHAGHLALLEKARDLGDVLVVAINSDRSVRALKGPGRPILSEAERAEALAAFESVDRVMLYDEPTPARVVSALLPDVLVKGADWGEGEIVGATAVEEAGGRVVRVDLVQGRSTTALVDRVRTM